MECTVLKSKVVSSAKALERIEKFVQRNAGTQADALAAEQAAQAALQNGEDPDEAAARGGSAAGAFAQHKINHLSPDVYWQLQLMRDAMRAELQRAAK
jgi:Tfp pilus assembly protein PilX